MVATQLKGSHMERSERGAAILLRLNNQDTDLFFSNLIRTEEAAVIRGLIGPA